MRGELGATRIGGFAVTTFVPSMLGAGLVNKGNQPVAFIAAFPLTDSASFNCASRQTG
jgi:hypothetical protein